MCAKVKAFFIFPETDEEILRLSDDPEFYKNILNEIGIIRDLLRGLAGYEIYYDRNNVNAFLDKADGIVNEEYLGKCRVQLQYLFKHHSQQVESPVLRNAACQYYSLDFVNASMSPARSLFCEAFETKSNESEHGEQTIFINISKAHNSDRDSIHVLKDATHLDGLPKLMVIPFVNNDTEFSEWCLTLSNPNFSLRDKSRFRATSFVRIKQRIFLELSTGRYWYFDYYHKENKRHYEVFNSAGVHDGEATELGELVPGSADDKKRIDHIINGN